MRMDAYYYGFDPTGVPEIDRILSAVACAGKAYHHTESWGEEMTYGTPNGAPDGHEGKTPIEWIQNAANDAARRLLQADSAGRQWRDVVAANVRREK